MRRSDSIRCRSRAASHFGSEEAEAPLPRRLGGVERKVRVAHQVVGRPIVIVGRDDAHGRADRNDGSVDRVRPRQAVDDPCASSESSSCAEVAGRTTSNSSPPSRRPAPVRQSRREAAGNQPEQRTRRCPSVSFTALNRSRSIRKTEQRCFRRAAPTSASSSARRRASRFARPVSESCRASRSSSTSDCLTFVRSDGRGSQRSVRPRHGRDGRRWTTRSRSWSSPGR